MANEENRVRKLFVAVGSQFPFDRLARAVDSALSDHHASLEVFGQIGNTSYKPKHYRAVSLLPHDQFIEAIRECDGVISHAGVGIILTCLELSRPILVMPRLAKYREVVNDHQIGTAKRLAEAGRILMANDENELIELFPKLLWFSGTHRPDGPNRVAERIRKLLGEVEST